MRRAGGGGRAPKDGDRRNALACAGNYGEDGGDHRTRCGKPKRVVKRALGLLAKVVGVHIGHRPFISDVAVSNGIGR